MVKGKILRLLMELKR